MICGVFLSNHLVRTDLYRNLILTRFCSNLGFKVVDLKAHSHVYTIIMSEFFQWKVAEDTGGTFQTSRRSNSINPGVGFKDFLFSSLGK